MVLSAQGDHIGRSAWPEERTRSVSVLTSACSFFRLMTAPVNHLVLVGLRLREVESVDSN